MKSLAPLVLLAAVPAPALAQQAIALVSGGGHSQITLTVPFGQVVQFNQLQLRPVQIVEDSRCPPGVRCVWQGRIVARFALAGGATVDLENGKPVAIAGGRLTLVGAAPMSRPGEKIPPAAYRFTLRFER